MTPRKYTASKRKQIIAHYQNGITNVTEIKKLTGCNKSYIYEVLRKHKAGAYNKKPEQQTGTTEQQTETQETPTSTPETAETPKVEFDFKPITPPQELIDLSLIHI